jgi:geranylgeranyl diphosphate synthase type I
MTTDAKEILKKMSNDIDAPIKSYIKDEDPSNLIEAVRQYPYAGGKRMRPAMVVTACGAVGGDRKKAVPLAVAIEYIHNFTLIHDDLMDGDDLRRGMITSHAKYGMPTAVLAGDALFAKAFEVMTELDVPDKTLREIMKVVTVAVWDLARGQEMDINNEVKGTVTMDDYVEMIRLKTSVLFAAGAAGGAMVGGADKKTVDAIHDYAMSLGVAFQMYDDILGVIGDPAKTGKSAGNDIRRGKNTVIVCHARETVKDKKKLDAFFKTFGKNDASDAEIEKAKAFLKESGSIDYAVSMAQKYTDQAIAKLKIVKDGPDKDFMIALAQYAMNRDV